MPNIKIDFDKYYPHTFVLHRYLELMGLVLDVSDIPKKERLMPAKDLSNPQFFPHLPETE